MATPKRQLRDICLDLVHGTCIPSHKNGLDAVSKAQRKPQHNIVMVIQVWGFIVVIAKIETHVIENVARLQVLFHLCCWQAIDEPVESIILAYAVVYEFCVLRWHLLGAEGAACSIFL